jgi:hypothetical protein
MIGVPLHLFKIQVQLCQFFRVGICNVYKVIFCHRATPTIENLSFEMQLEKYSFYNTESSFHIAFDAL